MSEKNLELFAKNSDVKVVSLEDEMKGSYLDYAMSVIVSRALPDVRDGLKPVHRRILFAMNEIGNDYNKPRRKSANVVGEVMGKYHPHGDAAIYDAMVRLAQNFNMGVTLIDGQGNFGSMDGDPAAAPRYTEARLSKISRELLDDIERDTVDFQPNYDDTKKEPTVLPAKFPNLLVNGSNGIAVGMATYIPTHNLGEVIDACCALIDNPDLSVDELIQYIPGPDFPTGAQIMGRGGIYQAYKTGRGSILVRSKTHIEEIRGGREAIVITEIPFQVNKARMVERIAELVKEKIITDISNLRDESDREGVRVVIELKKDAVSDVVLNQLYRFSPVQNSLSFNMLALVYGRPEQLSLKSILAAFLAFREDVVKRRTRFDLANARDRAHVLMGFAVALANLDEIIALIRRAADRATAKQELLVRQWSADQVVPLLSLVDDVNDPSQGFYRLSSAQADAILDLRLHRLTGLESQKIHDELADLSKTIAYLLDLLHSRDKILGVIKNELIEVKSKYAKPRRTVIEHAAATCEDEDLIQREDMVVTVSLEGYIKRVPLDTYRSQKRGGRGRAGMATKEEDVVNDVIVANTHNNILFFSTIGKVYSLKVHQLPLGAPQSKGRAMVNLFPLSDDEKISTVLIIPDDEDHTDKCLIFSTSLGNIRRNSVSDFTKIASNGKRAMRLDERELLIGVALATETDDVFISTSKGMANRFAVTNVRVFAGRDSNGVIAIRLDDGDVVTNMSIIHSNNVSAEERDEYYRLSSTLKAERGADGAEPDLFFEGIAQDGTTTMSDKRFAELAQKEQFILTVTENGFGKRTSAYAYRTTNRGTKGVANITMSARNGDVVSSFPVKETDDIMLVTNLGQLIRCPVKDIRITRRTAQGVIIFKVGEGEKVVAVSRVPNEGNEGNEEGGLL
ncbi:MAG: DNA gyrase subunit A [Holosporales bacterium]|jgi:DNA gyrase subunit A|nr:DNA gyrase subunit A [Holosporales bacterium]